MLLDINQTNQFNENKHKAICLRYNIISTENNWISVTKLVLEILLFVSNIFKVR